MAKALRDMTVNSLIGEGSEFRGEFKVNGLLRIDGNFTGEIKTKGKVLIGHHGKVHTDIHAGVIVIGGEVHGNIFAEKEVTILSTGKLYGNVVTPKMIIEEGVIFEGNCHINKPSLLSAVEEK
jgi:cytoskeletal protein CcmA (bactofilin family)